MDGVRLLVLLRLSAMRHRLFLRNRRPYDPDDKGVWIFFKRQKKRVEAASAFARF
ncbi:hypothetical protein CLOSTMETH_00329 [[Clostridium] methylpentosum DSM 5476]|uniref:Uncharacterized protein n=1 Tax=[Clostridium] methylpentosum DSM 5476 TaxID=537013 RepID=C0E934_9FIRM|nr:hypothetical protein CLOSTMETH_00329 [[Clostridium] methylpentosum DSM 5476]